MKNDVHGRLEVSSIGTPNYMELLRDDIEERPMSYVGFIMLTTAIGTTVYMKLSGMW